MTLWLVYSIQMGYLTMNGPLDRLSYEAVHATYTHLLKLRKQCPRTSNFVVKGKGHSGERCTFRNELSSFSSCYKSMRSYVTRHSTAHPE